MEITLNLFSRLYKLKILNPKGAQWRSGGRSG